MKITFLGTSHGVPEPHRRCSCTMIESGGKIYFIDMGFNALEEVITRGLLPADVRAIFVTHMHGDHTDGLIQFCDLCTWYFNCDKNGNCSPKIFVPVDGVGEAMTPWIKNVGTADSVRAEFIRFTGGVTYEDENIKVTSFGTQHCPNSFCHLVECEGKRVLFTGDLRNPTIDFPVQLFEEGLDLIVNEAAHFPATDYVGVYSGKKIGRVIFNHYAAWNYPHIDEMTKALDPLPVSRVADGDTVEL